MILLCYETPDGYLQSACLKDGLTLEDIKKIVREHKKNNFQLMPMEKSLFYNIWTGNNPRPTAIYRYTNEQIKKLGETVYNSTEFFKIDEPPVNYVGKLIKFIYPRAAVGRVTNKVRIVKCTLSDEVYFEGTDLTDDESHVKTFRRDKVVGDITLVS